MPCEIPHQLRNVTPRRGTTIPEWGRYLDSRRQLRLDPGAQAGERDASTPSDVDHRQLAGIQQLVELRAADAEQPGRLHRAEQERVGQQWILSVGN
jgi:hypothetical protein